MSGNQKVYVYSYGRSAIGRFGGSLKGLTPAQLGSQVVTGVLERAGESDALKPLIDEVIVGNVLAAGHGMNVSRQVSLGAGLPITSPATTVNMVCGSGLKAVQLGYHSVALGEKDAVICGGVESMSQAGHLLHGSRWGTKLGAPSIVDLLLNDGLTDAFESCHMGITAENLATDYSISREEQDDFAFQSQRKAAKAIQDGSFKDEIVSLEVRGPKRTSVAFEVDEHPRSDVEREGLTSLKPAFKSDGSVTAGNASGINDGAAFLLIGSEKFGERSGLLPQFELKSFATVGVEPRIMGIGPVEAVRQAASRGGVELSDIDAFELNEAFASQSLAVLKELKIDAERVNKRGGAIALGHPIGASGARILVTLLSILKSENSRRGIAALCVGGGQGIGALVERVG